jgi:hypothetical protein
LPESKARDLIEQEELVKERIRQLCSRYGVFFRELVPSHGKPLQKSFTKSWFYLPVQKPEIDKTILRFVPRLGGRGTSG